MLDLDLAWLIPVVPGGAFIVLLLLRNLLPRGGDFVAIGAIFASLVLFVLLGIEFSDRLADGTGIPARNGFDWVDFGDFHIRIGFYVDEIAIVMLLVVTVVALMVNVYSVGYMHGDKRYGWYYTVLALFAFSMLTLVLADNFLMLYLTWELVGLCSFLLIGFWYERRSAAEAAKKAFVTTRIGDVGLLIGIILFWRELGTFDFQAIIQAVEAGEIDDPMLTIATLLVFAGAVGKSAQVPLHVWLPDAMEGPTPVSALIHAATMVVAGVYLVARTLPIFLAAPGAAEVVTGIGLTTALLAATMGLVTTDIKRVLAYSTVSQLGFMFVALGVGSVTAAMFHLMTHAFFKALLFLGSGSVIHATDRQDVDQLGGLWRKMPITTVTFGIATLALAGIPPLAGFWSKDEILLAVQHESNAAVFLLLGFATFLSALYMTRLFVLTFLGEPKDRHAYEHAHESPPPMALPLVILAILTLVAGFVALSGVGEALGFPGGFGEVVFLEEAEEWSWHGDLAIGATLLGVAGVALGVYIWLLEGGRRAKAIGDWAPNIYALLANRYYIDDLYQAGINYAMVGGARIIAWFDRNIVNDTGVDGSSNLTVYLGDRLKYIETGKLPNYALGIVIGIVALALAAFATQT
ncbi:MAG TPA: NADH-quinone oxidoreductase subunit L [Dehalococcoidia bacterium]|nr:NADH-quinone oxidoreductase subunit L [Dehalococcoidia bacterium]